MSDSLTGANSPTVPETAIPTANPAAVVDADNKSAVALYASFAAAANSEKPFPASVLGTTHISASTSAPAAAHSSVIMLPKAANNLVKHSFNIASIFAGKLKIH